MFRPLLTLLWGLASEEGVIASLSNSHLFDSQTIAHNCCFFALIVFEIRSLINDRVKVRSLLGTDSFLCPLFRTSIPSSCRACKRHRARKKPLPAGAGYDHLASAHESC